MGPCVAGGPAPLPKDEHMRSPRQLRRRATAVTAVGAVITATGLAGLALPGASASSHREAPLISGAPQYDTTDVYAFVSPDKPDTTTLIANWIPFEEPAGGPNFYPFAEDAWYDINIDNDGDAKADITYRWSFDTSYRNPDTFLYNTGPVTSLTDPDLNQRESYTLTKITEDGRRTVVLRGRVAPSNVGQASMPDYAALRRQAVTSGMDGRYRATSFAGQADDPFFLDLRVFDLLYGGNLSEIGQDTLRGYNTNTIALQVPSAAITRSGDPVVGVWSTTWRKGASGTYRRVSRLGNPLVNEVVIPLKDKDRFNASVPVNDPQFLSYVTKPGLPKVIEAVYGIPAPAEPRNDLVQVFLTGVPGLNQPAALSAPGEMLRLNTSIAPSSSPNRLGVIGGDTAGFPNGRRLADDVVDIALQVVEGELVGSPNDLGDAVNANDRRFGSTFPYVALPHSGSRGPTTTVSGSAAGFTALTGGAATDGVPTPAGPAAPALALGVGLLTVLGGALVTRRARRAEARVGPTTG